MYINGALAGQQRERNGADLTAGVVGAYRHRRSSETTGSGALLHRQHRRNPGVQQRPLGRTTGSPLSTTTRCVRREAFIRWDQSSSSGQPQVSTPTFDPPAGTYTSTQTVTISTATYGASTAATPPTAARPAKRWRERCTRRYTGGVTVSSTTTLKAIAYKSGSIRRQSGGLRHLHHPAGGRATPTFSPARGATRAMRRR